MRSPTRARDTRPRARLAALPAAALALLLTPLVALPGCIVRVQHAALAGTSPGTDQAYLHAATRTDAPATDDPATPSLPWPDRWGHDAGVRGVILPVEGPLSIWKGVWLGEHHFLRAAQTEYDDAAALAKALAIPSGFRFRTEGPGSFIFARDAAYDGPDAKPLPSPTATDPAVVFKHVSATVTQTWDKVPGIEIQRTWFALYDPATLEPRGTLVILPGMFGTPEPVINSLVLSMRQRGWSVLRMLSHPSRFTERVEIPVDTTHPEHAAEELADLLTDRAAECAYAAHAAIAHAHTLRPALTERPTVLMGMSGGAIALPTVHALDPDRFDAAILIAGGVNFLRINIESNYADFIDAIHLDWTPNEPGLGKPTRAQADALCDAYLQRALLDAEFTAPLLASTPTLIIHASADRAVPAHLGDRLWTLAGEPERWTMPLGHELLFLTLPTQASRLDAWLKATLPGGEP